MRRLDYGNDKKRLSFHSELLALFTRLPRHASREKGVASTISYKIRFKEGVATTDEYSQTETAISPDGSQNCQAK